MNSSDLSHISKSDRLRKKDGADLSRGATLSLLMKCEAADVE